MSRVPGRRQECLIHTVPCVPSLPSCLEARDGDTHTVSPLEGGTVCAVKGGTVSARRCGSSGPWPRQAMCFILEAAAGALAVAGNVLHSGGSGVPCRPVWQVMHLVVVRQAMHVTHGRLLDDKTCAAGHVPHSGGAVAAAGRPGRSLRLRYCLPAPAFNPGLSLRLDYCL